MKKQIIYLLCLIVIGLYACTPTSDWDDMYDELENKDAKAFNAKYGKQVLSGSYTLTEADYKASGDEDVQKYKNFSSYADPKVLIPEILNKKFYTDSKGEEVSVTFDYYSRARADKDNAYELTDDDYESVGASYHNFNDDGDAKKYIPAILNTKPMFATEATGSLKTVKWVFYYSKTTEYIKVNSDFTAVELTKKPKDILYTLTEGDYTNAGQSYPSFSNKDDAKDAIINIARNEGKGPGNYAYTYYESRTKAKYNVFEKLDEGWVVKKDVNPQTLLFKYTDKFEWVFVPPIKFVLTDEAATVDDIELTDEDYALTGDSKYKNFYVKDMSEDDQNNVIVDKLTIILKANYNIKLNDVVKVKFKVYTGKGETWERTVKAVEDE